MGSGSSGSVDPPFNKVLEVDNGGFNFTSNCNCSWFNLSGFKTGRLSVWGSLVNVV